VDSGSRTVQWITWGGLGLVAAAIVVAFVRERSATALAGPLPVLGSVADVMLTNRISPVNVADLPLTNQLGAPVTLRGLAGAPFIADIIFTRCPGPCATMTRQLAELQAALPANSPVKLVSLTTDPEFDSPEVLKKYADRFGAQASRWSLLTGLKPDVVRAAVDGLKLSALEKPVGDRENEADLFIHSTIFVAVDRQGRLRAVVEKQARDFGEGEKPDSDNTPAAVWARSKTRLLAIADQLAREK
jgi:protein SCO1/2